MTSNIRQREGQALENAVVLANALDHSALARAKDAIPGA
jgi:hypothetical protein